MKRKVTIGIVSFISGIVLLFFSFGHHVADFLESHITRTKDNAQMIDDNIAEALGDYEATLDYLLNHKIFLGIHNSWSESGDGHAVQQYLTDHLLLQSRCIVNVLAVRDDEIVLTVNDKKDYSFEKIDGKDNYYLCEDTDGKIYLAVTDETPDNTQYRIIVDLDKFFDYTADEKQQLRDGVVFISLDGSFVIYQEHGQKYMGRMDEVIKEARNTECIEALQETHQNQKSEIVIYDHYNPKNDKESRGHILSVPVSETKNRFFTLGVVVNFGETIHSIQDATLLAVGSGILVAVGIILLINVTLKTVKEQRKRKRELQELYEKNVEMEKANLELQEQAHRQRLETIGILTAGVAHEFNNLLTPIMGYSMMSLELLPDDSNEIYDNLLEIYQSSRKAKDIISRLSEMARKKDAIVYEPFSIDRIIEKTLELLKTSKPRNVLVEKYLNCEGVLISCNETLIMQMILNLVLNSFQIMEETGGVVDITTRIEGDSMRISVGDTGPGISAGNFDKIFEPFFTTKYSIKGVGLGLSIVQQVVESHHGTISAKNKETGGCVFDIYLPLDK